MGSARICGCTVWRCFFFSDSISHDPTLIREILLWILLAGMALDISASLAAVFHIRKEMPTAIRWNKKVAVWTQKFALMIVGHVEKRMAKAYPVIMEKTEQIEKEGNFAEGCGFINYSGCF